ncbi:MAG: nuclear transport factor 2 family protein [Sphingomonadales bacterium]|nr:nuclear transport factor 2 family protein [Sphingomonadales bacterium]MBD3773531.1 nuclear transport factor 2 family protein [Paracoccaceae bacterium]
MRGLLPALAALAALALPGGAQAAEAGTAAVPPPCTMSARQVVDAFIPLFYQQRNATEAFARWVAPGYRQHNPNAPDGAAAAVAFLQPFFDANPQMRYTVKRVFGSDGLVAVHYHWQLNPEDRGTAVVDIFRVADCKIVEHWDVIQPVPETSANDNTMF